MSEPGRARELRLLRRPVRVLEDQATGEGCVICAAPERYVVVCRDEHGIEHRLGVCPSCRTSFVA